MNELGDLKSDKAGDFDVIISLFVKEKLTLGQASKLAKMSQFQFQQLLTSRQIPLHYDLAELEADVKTLQQMGRL